MKRIRVLKEDVSGRFHKGELGLELTNDYHKYDHKILLDEEEPPIPGITSEPSARVYYFYKGEIEYV